MRIEAAAGAALSLDVLAGGQRFAIDAAVVSEVARRPPVTRVPMAPPALAGLAHLRGRVLPVVALARLVEAPAAAGEGAMLVVVEHPEPLAIAVDAVGRLGDATAEGARALVLDGLLGRVFGAATALRGGEAARSLRAGMPAQAGVTPGAAAERRAILRFGLAGQTYGLPLDAVRAVRDAPAEILRMCAGDAAVPGVVEHRGRLLPVVRPDILLGLPAGPPRTAGRIVVAGFGRASLGLLVDRLDAIEHVEADRIARAPALLNRDGGEARIDAVARTGRGLVALLSVQRLFRDEAVAATLEEDAEEDTPMAAGAEAEKLLLFRLGDETYALPVGAVEEVIRYPDAVTRIPRAPGFLAGVVGHRGALLPVVEQRTRFAVPGVAPAAGRRVIVMLLDGVRVGFAVDAVEAIRAVAADDVSATPDIAGTSAGQLFHRVARIELDGRLVLLVNAREMLDRAERDLVAAAAAASPGGGPA